MGLLVVILDDQDFREDLGSGFGFKVWGLGFRGQHGEELRGGSL